jgi:alanyl-tRNA synthetase
VHALGFIGPIKIVSEGSVGANLRRIEALTGQSALAYIRDEEHALRGAAEMLKVGPTEVGERIGRLLAEAKTLRDELDAERARQAVVEAGALAEAAKDGVVVARRDGLTNDGLRRLALATRDALGSGIVGLVGVTPDGAKAAVAVAVSKDLVGTGITAGAIAADAARALGGGTGKQPDVAVGGGPNAGAVGEAEALLAQRANEAAGSAPGAH